MQLTQPLHKALVERPSATALVCAGRRTPFVGFVRQVARLAAVLRQLGLQPGDRVAMLGPNSDHYVVFFYAVWWAGGVINPVNMRWSAAEIAYSLDDCNTRILLVDAPFHTTALALPAGSVQHLLHWGDGPAPAGLQDGPTLAAAARPVPDALRHGDDLAAVMYTGGTTGKPKGVMLSHSNLGLNALCANQAAQRPVNACGDAVGLTIAPMFHVGGMGLVLQLMLRLGRQIILPAFDEVALLQAITAEQVSETFLVPTMLQRLIDHPRFASVDASCLQLVLYGAAPIDAALLARAQHALPAAGFCQLYGMTELSPVASALPAWCHAPGQPAGRLRSAGRPLPIAELRIVDPDDQPVPTGSVGEIVVRGPLVMQGYWGQPQLSAEALRGGWMHTGDGGVLDADGFVTVVDRLKDMIVSGGENIYSAEVENAIAQHPAVAMAAVIGVPDAQWGERVHAVVVLQPGAVLTAETLASHCRKLIAGYKCPRSLELRAALPLSAAGKVLKVELRAPFWAGHSRQVN